MICNAVVSIYGLKETCTFETRGSVCQMGKLLEDGIEKNKERGFTEEKALCLWEGERGHEE